MGRESRRNSTPLPIADIINDPTVPRSVAALIKRPRLAVFATWAQLPYDVLKGACAGAWFGFQHNQMKHGIYRQLAQGKDAR